MKKKILISGIIGAVIMLVSAILPYYVIKIYTDEMEFFKIDYINFLNAIINYISTISIIIYLILSIKNYIKFKSNEKLIRPGLLLFLCIMIAFGIISMIFTWELYEWGSDESGFWSYHSNGIGYYSYRVGLVYIFINTILLINLNKKGKI